MMRQRTPVINHSLTLGMQVVLTQFKTGRKRAERERKEKRVAKKEFILIFKKTRMNSERKERKKCCKAVVE